MTRIDTSIPIMLNHDGKLNGSEKKRPRKEGK